MLTEITGSGLRQALTDFRKRISSELSRKGRRRFSFPGGGNGESDNYETPTPYGLLSIMIVDDDPQMNRHMHYINLDQPNRTVASDTEINIPKGKNSRIATVIAGGPGHRFICNRGYVTVHMGSLKSAIVLEHFAKQFQSVVQVRRMSGEVKSVIRIADLDSRSLFADIARFTRRMKDFKQQFRKSG